MHLVYKALEKYAIPSILPGELLPPAKRKTSTIANSPVPVLPVVPSGITSNLVKQPPKVSFWKTLITNKYTNYVKNIVTLSFKIICVFLPKYNKYYCVHHIL